MQRKVHHHHHHNHRQEHRQHTSNTTEEDVTKEHGHPHPHRTMITRISFRKLALVLLCGYICLRSRPQVPWGEQVNPNSSSVTVIEPQQPTSKTNSIDIGDPEENTEKEQPQQYTSTPDIPATAAIPVPVVQVSQFPQFIEDYIQFHQEAKFTENARYLIWRCPRGTVCGGTGDRIKGIMSAFYTAICTRRVLLIDWPLQDARDVSPFLLPHRIDWRIPDQMISHLATRIPLYNAMDNYNQPSFKQLKIPDHFQQQTLIDMRSNLWSEHFNAIVRVNDTECVQSIWQKEPPRPNHPHYTQDKYLFRMGFWTMFTFGDAVHERKREIQQQTQLLLPLSQKILLKEPQSRRLHAPSSDQKRRSLQQQSSLAGQTTIQPYVAVHIRTGIGSNWNDPLRHGSEEDYQMFYQCAKRLQQGIYHRQRQQSNQCQTNPRYDYQKQLPLLPIYVAADNKVAKQALLQMDQDASATTATPTTIRALQDMEIYHIDRSQKQGNQAENTVWAELNVLLESTCLVASRSGFSDLANWLQPTLNGKRCAILFQECDDEAKLQQALDNLDFNTCG